MKFKKTIGSVLIALGLVLGGISANAASLSVPVYAQEDGNWCWVTAVQMIGKYLTGTRVSQCNLVKAGKLTKGCDNLTGSDTDAQRALSYAGVTMGSSTKLTWSKLNSEIDGKRPIYSHVAWKTGGGHAHAVKGYSIAGSTTYINYNDPDGGVTYSKAWSSYQNNSRFSLYSTLTGLRRR